MKTGKILKTSFCLILAFLATSAFAIEKYDSMFVVAASDTSSTNTTTGSNTGSSVAKDVKNTLSNTAKDAKEAASNASSDVKKESEESKNYLSDAEITAKVKEKFIEEKLFGKEKISAMGIHVKTNKGVVYLRGKVGSQEQADNAVSLAKSVSGVKDVKSLIKVKGSTSSSAKESK